MFECLRAGAGEAAQPTGRLPHQVHGPTISSQGKEHIIAHILVHVHLSLREEKADRWTNTNTHTHTLASEQLETSLRSSNIISVEHILCLLLVWYVCEQTH